MTYLNFAMHSNQSQMQPVSYPNAPMAFGFIWLPAHQISSIQISPSKAAT